MVGSGCLTARKAYASIDWPILLFVIGTIGLGKAMAHSGAAKFLAEGMVAPLTQFGPAGILFGLLSVCAILTNFISNQAVAVLLTPIAVGAAQAITEAQGLPADEASIVQRAFILAIAFGASISFATPVGHQSNLMVYGPGGYQFGDFVRIGVPVSILCVLVAFFGIPLMTGMPW